MLSARGRYTSELALETLATAFQDACSMLGEFHNIFHHQLAVSGQNIVEIVVIKTTDQKST